MSKTVIISVAVIIGLGCTCPPTLREPAVVEKETTCVDACHPETCTWQNVPPPDRCLVGEK